MSWSFREPGLASSVRIARAAGRNDEGFEEGTAVDADSPTEGVADPVPTLETADGRAHLGDLYARAGLMPEAIAAYRQSIRLDPENALRHFKLGLVYQSLRRFEEALAAYEEAARLEPDSAWALAAVSIVQAKMGRQADALETYRRVKSLDGEMAEGLLEIILQYGSRHEV